MAESKGKPRRKIQAAAGIATAVGHDFDAGLVIVQFGKDVKRLSLSPEWAEDLAGRLLHHAEMLRGCERRPRAGGRVG